MKTTPALYLLPFVLFAWATFELYHLTLADIHASLGNSRLAANDHEAAISSLQQAINHTQSNAAYYHDLGESLYACAGAAKTIDAALNSLLSAKDAYQKAATLNPLEGNTWLGLAQTCWWLSRFDGRQNESDPVESYFFKALATDPQNGKFLYAMVNYHLSVGRPDPAIPYVKKLAVAYPNAYPDLKKAPWWSTDLRAPYIEGLEEAVENPLTDSQALALLASLAAEDKDWPKAVHYTQVRIRRAQTDPSHYPYINLGCYHLQLGNQEAARDALLQALKLSTDRQQTLEHLLWRCRETGDLELYVELCRDTAKRDWSVRNRLPLLLAKAYFQNNDLEMANHYLRQSLAAGETAEARRYLAEIAMQRKEWDTAELESQRATVLDPQDSYHHYLFARSLQAQRKYRAALEAASEAIRRAERPPEAYHNLAASLHWQLKEYGQAVKSWQAARLISSQKETK